MSKNTSEYTASSIAAVVVTFEPEKAAIFDLLQALESQVGNVFIVDNASSTAVSFLRALCTEFSFVEFLELDRNVGLAAAQNRGIAIAMERGVAHILLLDQDSVPEPDMVSRLLMGLAMCKHESGSLPIAAISPATKDIRTGHVSTFIPADGRACSLNIGVHQGDTFPTMDVGFLISSGMLIPAEVFSAVGGLRSEYFIDHVDTEWCFRARAKGYRLVGVIVPLLRHSLGEEVQKVWLFRERHVSTHSPLRDYYMARNTLAMIKGGSLSIAWCAHFLWRIVQFFGFYMLLSNNKRPHLKMLFLGLLHGLSGINGKLNPETLQTEPVPRSPLDPGR